MSLPANGELSKSAGRSGRELESSINSFTGVKLFSQSEEVGVLSSLITSHTTYFLSVADSFLFYKSYPSVGSTFCKTYKGGYSEYHPVH